MMQHSVLDELRPSLHQTLGLTDDGLVLLARTAGMEPVAASTSARLHPTDVRAFVASRCEALVLRTACGALVIIDFVASQKMPQQRPTMSADNVLPARVQHQALHCDELHIGSHARIYSRGSTLLIRARNIDLRADEQQRLRGATISIG